MRQQNIVRDMVDRRGTAIVRAAPGAAALASTRSYAPSALPRSRPQPVAPARTSPRSPNVTELTLHVDGFSVVVRFFPDDVSAKREPGRGAAETRSSLLNTFEKVFDRIRGSSEPVTDSTPKSVPAAPELAPDADAATMPRTATDHNVLRVGTLELDLLERTARRGDRQIALRPREFRLLRYMMERSETLLTRAKLLQEVWNYKFVPQTNLVDVHMGRLRRKVDDVNEPAMIRNIRGAGFVLSASPLIAGL